MPDEMDRKSLDEIHVIWPLIKENLFIISQISYKKNDVYLFCFVKTERFNQHFFQSCRDGATTSCVFPD